MNLIKKFALSALTVAAIAPTLALADGGGTINFEGELTDNTCTIAGNGAGKDFTVTLPKIGVSAVNADPADGVGNTKFTIKLSNCTPTAGTVSLYFEPSAKVDLATGRLKNTEGTATNVEVGLKNADFSKITLGNDAATQNSQAITITGGNSAEVVYWAAYYKAPAGTATAGTVKTSTVYTLMWN
jgi:major type 1 subunit fimbrin (pilin)